MAAIPVFMAHVRAGARRLPQRFAMVVVAAFCCLAVGLSRAHAQTAIIGGTLNYTGSLGPVSGSRPLCLCLYSDPDLQLEIGCAIYTSNNVQYRITLGSAGDYYLIAFVDLLGNESLDPSEPYEIYRDRAAPPADAVTAGPSQTHIDFVFGDENLPGAPTRTAPPTQVTTPTPTPTVRPCAGDCNGSGEVTIDEIITMVNIALGTADLTACQAGDTNGNNSIEVNEIIQAVNNAAGGCTNAAAVAG